MLRRKSAPRQQTCARTERARARLTLLIAATLVAAICAGCAPSNSEILGQQKETRERRVTNNEQTTGGSGVNSQDETGKTEMPDENAEKKSAEQSAFYAALKNALRARKIKLESFCDTSDPVERRVLEDYGAMFLADSHVLPPPVCMFTSEADVEDFQERARPTAATIGGARIELQPAALEALVAAREEARAMSLDITPRGGEEAARRSYDDTLHLWNTRFLPALSYWNKKGRLSKEQVEHLRALPLRDQVREVLELEKTGIYFSKDLSKSILYSIAAPGTSQHIAMLALDVDQFADERVRRILARHGWFQTVKSDLPHFTYLGLEEKELPKRGLRAVVVGKQLFWIPNVGGE
jgi:hypothetical protein